MINLIGLGMAAVGAVLTIVTGIYPFASFTILGVVLLTSVPCANAFYDYRIVNSDDALVRKRYYINSIVLYVIFSIITLGKGNLIIPYKEEYFKMSVRSENDAPMTPLTRNEYLAIRNEQRSIYCVQPLNKEFMEESYTVELIGFKRKKRRLIAAIIVAVILLSTLTVPEGIFLALIWEAVFIPMIILWIPDYKDAKILQQAYDKAVNLNANQKAR